MDLLGIPCRTLVEAVGVGVRKWISMHGVSMSCMAHEAGRDITVAEAATVLET
ncbi:MAG: hypothetical protein V4819_18640 [Verrucomicrobiota bacterium]